MTTDSQLPTPEGAPDQKVIDDVLTHGWHVSVIGSDGETVGWAFSVGMFHTLGHPEIILFGLSQEVMHWVINEIGRRVQEGERVEPDAVWLELIEGYPCTFKPVSKVWYYPLLGYARWFYRGDEFPTMQCIYPDKQGHWPWERDIDAAWFDAQPLLYEESPKPARMEKILASMGLGAHIPGHRD